MTSLTLLLALAGCTDDTSTLDSALPPDTFAARITSHDEGDTLLEGYRVGLSGVVNDPDGINSDVAVSWTVDGVEECPETTAAADGTTACDVVFGAGAPVVVLEARAPDGESTQAAITLEVLETQPPTAVITEPTDAATVSNDPGVYLLGQVADAEDAASALLTTWSSDVQGPLAGSAAPTDDGLTEALIVLDPGPHTLTLSVIDATGKTGTASVAVQVQ